MMYDFLFDFNRHYGSILNRLARNKLLPVYTSGLCQPEVDIWPRVGCFRFVGERTYMSMVSEKIVRISSETAEI